MNLSLPAAAAGVGRAALCFVFLVFFLADFLALVALRVLPKDFFEAVRGRGGVSLAVLPALFTGKREVDNDNDAPPVGILVVGSAAVGVAKGAETAGGTRPVPVCDLFFSGVAVKLTFILIDDDEFSFPRDEEEELMRYDGVLLDADTTAAEAGGSISMLTFLLVMTAFFDGMGVQFLRELAIVL